MMRHPAGIGAICGLLCVALFGAVYGVVLATEISDVTISNITDQSATVTWTTDVDADSAINFGLDSRVGTVRDPSFDKKEHSVKIDALESGKTYYLNVVSSDKSGNRSGLSGFTFTTKGASQSKPQAIIEEIEKLDEEELREVVEKVQEQAQDVLRPPSIVGPPKVTAESSSATISWATDRESTSMVYFATDREYASGKSNPYVNAQGDAKTLATNHEVRLTGLEPSTLYHFIVSSEDSTGLSGESADETFRTKSELPEITDARVSRVQEHSALVSWSNGVPAKGIVEYTNTRSRVTKLAGNPVYAASHQVQLNDLEFGARYSVVIRATNEAGDEVSSDPITFITVRDRVAPLIAKVNNESTLFPGEEVKIQTIVAWETDEPAYCQVFYSQGLAATGGGDSLPLETNPDTTHTQVIVGFAPATVYQFWMTCADEAGNESRSEDFVLITPVKEKSIIDIILENFEGTFGWLKNIGG